MIATPSPDDTPSVTAVAEHARSGDGGDESRVGRNLAALASGQMVTWTMTLAWTLVVPRALGPAGIGLIVAAWSATGILGILLGLGTRPYLVREIVVNRLHGPRLVGTAIVLRVVLSPLFVAGVIVYAQLAHYRHDGTLVLYLAGGATLLTLLAEPLQAAFQAVERMQYLAYSDVINKSGQGLLGVALAVAGFRSVGITAAWLVVAGVVIALDAFWLRGLMSVTLRTTPTRLVEMASQSVAYWAFGLFFTIYLWIDSVMLSLMTRPEVVGWYGVPTRLFQSLMFLPVLVSTAWLPRLVNAFRNGSPLVRQTARAPLELVLMLSLPITAATAIAARPMIHLLYGSRYDPAVAVLVILGLCVPPMYLNIMLNQVLVAEKRQASWTRVMALATVLNPLFNAILIPVTESRYRNGAIGAAISLFLTELVIVTIGLRMIGHGLFDRPSVRRIMLSALASAAMWLVAYVTRSFGTVASVTAGAVTFVAAAAAFRLATTEQLALLRQGVARVLHR